MNIIQPGAVLYTQSTGSRPESVEVPHYDTRAPTVNDVLYPLGKKWLFIGDSEWLLLNFYFSDGKQQANWISATGDFGSITEIGVPNGDSPIDPDASGLVNFTSTGSTVTITGSAGGLGLQNINFDLPGSLAAIQTLTVQANTAPGVTTVTPTSGNITVNGSLVAAHSVPIETRSRALHVYNVEAQVANVVAATPANTNSCGMACYNNAQFDIDATSGMVSLQGSTGPALTKLTMQTGTTPVIPDVTGAIALSGAVVSAGTNPIRTDGTGANTATIEVQKSQSLVAADATKIGLCNFDSASFTVDSSGFVTLNGGPDMTWVIITANQTLVKGTGYMCTGGGALNALLMPASATIGDEIIVTLDGSTSFTITQPASVQIRVGASQTTAGVGGSIASTAQGDTIHMVAQTSTRWNAISWVGSLTVT